MVAVDVSPVRDGTGGVGRYVTELLAHLPAHAGGRPLRILPLTNRHAGWTAWTRANSPDAGGAAAAAIERAPRPVLGRPTLLWLQAELPIRCRQRHAAVIHCTTGRAALIARRPIVLTVHDTAVIDAPELFAYRERMLAGIWLRASVPRTRRLICVSDATAQDVLRRWPQTAGRLVVIQPGLAPMWLRQPAPLAPELAAAVGARWWLHVGACTRRKNVVALVEAFALARPRVGQPAPVLALAGPPGDGDAAVRQAAARLGIADHVRMLGPVDDGALHGLYAGAEVTACVSLAEGFGLTALEAVGCGCPVVTSGRGGLMEAAPAGALIASPDDPRAIAVALTAIATEPATRARLSLAGRAYAARRTSQHSAQETAAVYALAARPVVPRPSLARRP